MKKKTHKARAKSARPSPKASAAPVKKSVGGHKHFHSVLSKKREEILRTVKEKNEDLGSGEIGDEADVASQTFEREMMFELTNGERIILDDIEAALRKIEKGDFGVCESCHRKITTIRLNAMPWARCCIECQSRAEAPARA